MRQAAMVIDNGALTKEPLGYSPTPYFHGEQLLSEMADMMLLLLNFFCLCLKPVWVGMIPRKTGLCSQTRQAARLCHVSLCHACRSGLCITKLPEGRTQHQQA